MENRFRMGFNDKQVAALAISNLIMNLDLLRDCVVGVSNDWVDGVFALVEDGITKIALGITGEEDNNPVQAYIVEHAKNVLDNTDLPLDTSKLAKEALSNLIDDVVKQNAEARLGSYFLKK